jgi:pyrroline-5-carboxylate reductase
MRLGGPLLLVGCGKMGGALLSGWLGQGLAEAETFVVEPFAEAREAIAVKGVTCVGDLGELDPALAPAVVVFAIKPQQMVAALPAYRRFVRPGTVFLSIAAGKTIGFFEGHLGREAAIVRAMPNTPAAIGRGISVLCPNARASRSQRQTCGRLMQAAGEVAWVDEEALLDPVTAVSGSGPAYVFLLVEALAEAGMAAGLPEELAVRLARETVSGAGELVRRSGESAETLRRNVTSPGGTTQAALEVLMAEDGLKALMTRAVAAADRRSKELAS